MKMSRAALFVLSALAGCGPDVIDLALFGLDAGGGAGATLDAGAQGEGELDADPPRAAMDAALDTGRMQFEFDARMRGDADRGDADRSSGCTGKDDCAAGQVCDIVGCSPNSRRGTCVAAETCDGDFEPVCGCDGFKYFNDCIRRKHGAAKDGECATVRSCGNNSCPTRADGVTAHCGVITQRTMGVCRSGDRACYVLPESCSNIPANAPSTYEVYAFCDPNISVNVTGGWEICQSACEMLKLGLPIMRTQYSRCARFSSGGGAPGGGGTPGGGPGFPGFM